MFKFFKAKIEVWQKTPKGFNSVTLNLNQNGWLMLFAHCLSELNIWAKFHENPSKNVGDMEFFTLSLDPDF